MYINTHTIVETNLPLEVFKKGKVRDVYSIDDRLLIVATDRISAFDHVLPDPIPNKGIYLTQISLFWFDKMKKIVENHVITGDIDNFPKILKSYKGVLQKRSMIVKKVNVFPIECIVRGYISGSAWKIYKEGKNICGIELPAGLRESEQLEEPIFTPSTKATYGHDENITFKEMEKIIGKKKSEEIKDISIEIYKKANEYANKRGIIIADTKFEFGLINKDTILVDELLTPDSSRFWPLDSYEPGKPQPSFDKQYVRDYLSSIGWDKNSDPPHLPNHVIKETEKKYKEAYERLTGLEINL